MEQWVPLFDVFLNSPCPENDASVWLQQSFNSSSNITTNSFISLLTKPTDSTNSTRKRVMWIQTLPNAIQARVISYLAFDHRRFCSHRLSNFARMILSDGDKVEFWVEKAARQLLDKMSDSSYEWVSGFNLDSEGESGCDDFGSVPDWLMDAASTNDSVLSWLPVSANDLNLRTPFGTFGHNDEEESTLKDEGNDKMEIDVDIVGSNNDPIEPATEVIAARLKTEMLNVESTSKTLELAKEICQICIGKSVDSFAILGLLEPWKVSDETASILLSHLVDETNDQELGWPSYVLSSVVLPKLLVTKKPVSRILVKSTIEYCKVYQKAAVYALLFPLIFVKQGINNPISDVMIRIMKECLHPAHVSSFCQNLLCGKQDERKSICLSCHKCLISDQMVWNESVFTLFYNVLNHNVHLTQDSVDRLVQNVLTSVDSLSKSLKFGNFLLCLVNKCSPLLKFHKNSLIEAVEKTNTLVTKSILSKLATL